jgi:hypothetical protein
MMKDKLEFMKSSKDSNEDGLRENGFSSSLPKIFLFLKKI